MKLIGVLTLGLLAVSAATSVSARMYNQPRGVDARSAALIQGALANSIAQQRAEREKSGDAAQLNDNTSFNECGEQNIGPQIAPGAEAPDTVVVYVENAINYCGR